MEVTNAAAAAISTAVAEIGAATIAAPISATVALIAAAAVLPAHRPQILCCGKQISFFSGVCSPVSVSVCPRNNWYRNVCNGVYSQ